MTNPIIRIHDLETDKITDRPMTDSEYTQFQNDQKIENQRIKQESEKATAKAALLAKLGITEEEAALLA